MHFMRRMEKNMNHKKGLLSCFIILCGTCLLLCGVCLLAGFHTDGDPHGQKDKITSSEAKQTTSYSSTVIPVDKSSKDSFVYHPVDHTLSQIYHNGQTYTRSVWQPEKGWTTNVDSWKIKKHETLENFTYNTNGALYACRKKWKKATLISQTLVRLRSQGRIKEVPLTGISHPDAQGTSSRTISEIMDLQCCGTSIAITYQYGTVKIYNLAEGQALGASVINGTPRKNIFYDLHYITILQPENSNTILLRDCDIRSGEIIHSFPLGSAGQDERNFHVSNCQNDLYVLTSRGLFTGQCTDTTLTKLLSYHDLKLPEQSHVVYLQAGWCGTLYLGYQTREGEFQLRLITIPEDLGSPDAAPQNSEHPVL